jgi:hypothetical protein
MNSVTIVQARKDDGLMIWIVLIFASNEAKIAST